MLNSLYERITKINDDCTTAIKKVTSHLLAIIYDEIAPDFETIQQLADIVGVSVSVVDKFVKIGGWPSFKHFYFEFINKEPVNSVKLSKGTISPKDNETIYRIAKNLQGTPNILCSKKTRPIGELLKSRFADIGVRVNVFIGERDEIATFLRKTKNSDSLLLITVSGQSSIITKALEQIAVMNKLLIPKITIISSSQWIKIFEKYDFINTAIINQQTESALEKWTNYNESILKIIEFLMGAIKLYYDARIEKMKTQDNP